MTSPAAPWCLLVDTSLAGIGMGLCALDQPPAGKDGPALNWQVVDPEPQAAARRIDQLFTEATQHAGGVPPYMVVGHGPGSFTGIKIGLGFAQGVQMGSPVRVRGASALAASAATLANEQQQSGPAAMFLRATRTHGFVSWRADTGAVWRDYLVEASSDGLLKVFQAIENIPDFLMSVSDWPALELALGSKLAMEVDRPACVGAALRGFAKLAVPGALDEFRMERPTPHYLRLSTAEESLGREVRGDEPAVLKADPGTK